MIGWGWPRLWRDRAERVWADAYLDVIGCGGQLVRQERAEGRWAEALWSLVGSSVICLGWIWFGLGGIGLKWAGLMFI